MPQPSSIRLFISYAHKDNELREELETHLKPLMRMNIVQIWNEWQIDAGQEWEKSIREKPETADVVLLLISPDFLASKFCIDTELRRAMERHEAGEVCVIPVFLRLCDWKDEAFGKLQGVPDDAKPITQWENRDEAFTLVTRAVRKAALALVERRQAHEQAEQEAEAKQKAEERRRQEEEEKRDSHWKK